MVCPISLPWRSTYSQIFHAKRELDVRVFLTSYSSASGKELPGRITHMHAEVAMKRAGPSDAALQYASIDTKHAGSTKT